jgi:hypothetical protein
LDTNNRRLGKIAAIVVSPDIGDDALDHRVARRWTLKGVDVPVPAVVSGRLTRRDPPGLFHPAIATVAVERPVHRDEFIDLVSDLHCRESLLCHAATFPFGDEYWGRLLGRSSNDRRSG